MRSSSQTHFAKKKKKKKKKEVSAFPFFWIFSNTMNVSSTALMDERCGIALRIYC